MKTWAKDLNKHFSKEEYKWLISTWKDPQHHQPPGKCNWENHRQASLRSDWNSHIKKKMTTARFAEDLKNLEPSHIPGGILKRWKTIRLFLKKLNAELAYDPVIPLLSIYPKTTENRVLKQILFTHVHSNAIYNSQKVEVSTQGWVHKQDVIYTNKKILLSHKKEWNSDAFSIWIKFENVLSDKKPDQELHSLILFIWNIQNGKPIQTENILVADMGWKRGMWNNCLLYRVFFGVIKMFWNSIELVVQHCECTEYHWIIPFKIVNFMLCEFNFKWNLNPQF